MTALNRTGTVITSTLDLDKLLTTVLQLLVENVGFSRILLMRYDPATRLAFGARTAGVPEEVDRAARAVEIPIEDDRTMHAEMLLHGRTFLVPDINAVADRIHPAYLALARQVGVTSFVCAPLKSKDAILGYVAADKGTELCAQEDMDLLASIANYIAVASDNALAYQQLERLTLSLEQRVRERTRDFEIARDQAMRANRHKSEFLASMSHELRTPLNAVIGFSEVLLEKMFGPLNDKQGEYVRDILSSGRHLLSLINDILDLSKIEAGRMDLELTSFDLPTTMSSAVMLISDLAKRHGLELVLEVDEGLQEVTADERKVKQIILNLLSNAVKFTPDGGKIWLGGARAGNMIEVWVKDTGIGIASEDQARIFEEFRQVGGDQVRKREGTGLGLTLAKKFVELHEGRIWVDSEVGRGSTFRFTLPLLAPVHEEPVLKPAVDLAAPQQHPLVLVAEDDAASASLLSINLTEAGFMVELAQDGELAFQKAKTLRPAVITLDILMPKINGWNLLARLKADPQTTSIPVIIVSILDERNKGFALGAADYLVKPVERQQFLAAVRRHAPVVPGAQRPTILAVDDDPLVLGLLESIFSGGSFTLLSANRGLEGIRLARERQPRVIILDLMMPEVDGFQVLDELKRDPLTASIPVVVLTARMLSKEDESRLRGRVSYLAQKSEFKPSEFIALVRSFIV